MALRDQLNVSSRSELYTFTLQDDQALTTLGISVSGDSAAELWYYNASSMLSDNGETVIKPNSILVTNPGRFLRITQETHWDAILEKPNFSDVATSGDYNDLSNKPASEIQDLDDVLKVSNQSTESIFLRKTTGSVFIEVSSEDKQAVTLYADDNNATLLLEGSYNEINRSSLATPGGEDLYFTKDVTVTNIMYGDGRLSGAAATNSNEFVTKGQMESQGYLTNSDLEDALGFTPVNNQTTITINGTTQNLSTNRTWNVGDLLSSGSYSNPSWITSLNWSKITNTPTTLSGYGITDGITTTALNTALSGKENSIVAGTTAQYYRGDKTWQTLNTNVVPEGTNLYFTEARVKALITPSFNNTPSITLNTSSQISTTKNTKVSYTVAITTAISLLNLNSSAQAFLEISADNSTWITINSAGTTRTLSAALTLSLNETVYFNIQGEVPAGYYRRIRTITAGGGTVTLSSGQEVQY